MVMEATDRKQWLLVTMEGFELYTDDHNLIFQLDPLAMVPYLKVSSLRKVLRWAIRTSM